MSQYYMQSFFTEECPQNCLNFCRFSQYTQRHVVGVQAYVLGSDHVHVF